LYFLEEKTDYVVLEVGLGGRFDATNAIDSSLLSIITSISMDHVNILGDNISKIAYEKAGIIKKNGNVVMYPQSKDAEDILKDVCKKENASIDIIDFSSIRIKKSNLHEQIFDFKIDGIEYKDVKISLIGEHQINNAVVAVAAIKNLIKRNLVVLSDEQIINGLSKTKWPGRIEIIRNNPTVIIDGAHNLDGAKSLSKVLKDNFEGKKQTLIIGMLSDKDIDNVIKELSPHFKKVITTKPLSDRSLSSDELKVKFMEYVDEVVSVEDIKEAVKYTLSNANTTDIIVAAGSLYMIGTIRTMLNQKK
jgi:dihydrofolate synthase/folylpolyglutamate synthase